MPACAALIAMQPSWKGDSSNLYVIEVFFFEFLNLLRLVIIVFLVLNITHNV